MLLFWYNFIHLYNSIFNFKKILYFQKIYYFSIMHNVQEYLDCAQYIQISLNVMKRE